MARRLVFASLRRTAKIGVESVRNLPEFVRKGLGSVVPGNRALNRVELGKTTNVQDSLEIPVGSGVRIVRESPDDGHYMTTFFDVPAVSRSGRFLALTRVPFIWRRPLPTDAAIVYVVDRERRIATPVYRTRGWGSQLGAGVQWGADEETIYCNDVVDGQPRGVRVHWTSGRAVVLQGTVYGTPSDASVSYSPDLRRVNELIPGYGVPDPLFPPRRAVTYADDDDGVWQTDLRTGEKKRLVTLRALVEGAHGDEPLRGGRWSIFHVKPNRQGTRIFALLFGRGVPGYFGAVTQLVTFNSDGSGIRLAMPFNLWKYGGHHPNWSADGENIVMNLRAPGEPMRFVQFRFDGTMLRTIAEGRRGSGHPSVSPDGRYLVTDAYAAEGFANSKGEVPVRLIDLKSNHEAAVCWLDTGRIQGPRRVDPHPVWSSQSGEFFVNYLNSRMRAVLSVNIEDAASLFDAKSSG